MTQNVSLRGRAGAVALVVLLMAALALVFARPAQAEQTGSIAITLRDTNQRAIGGGKVAIYQVGRINGSSYAYVGDFVTIGDDLTSHIPNDPEKGKVDSAYLDQLEDIARQSGGPLQAVDIDSRGNATLAGLEPGVYLVVQTESASGYNPFDGFLVTIPFEGSYNVDASPKLGSVTSTTPGNPGGGNPGTPSGGTGTTTPASGTTPTAGGTLPQTGQLWWPVALLGAAGVAFVVAGKRSNGKRAHES